MGGFAAGFKATTIYSFMDFWSNQQTKVLLTTGAADIALDPVTISGLPGGHTILRVIGMMVVGYLQDISGGTNYTGGESKIRINVPGGTWDVNDIDMIDLVSESMLVGANLSLGSIMLFGHHDIKANVQNGWTCALQWEDASANADSIRAYAVHCGIRVFYSV